MTQITDKMRAQAREQILYNIVQIIETFPQYTIAQHLLHILRKKLDPIEPYFWSDGELLKKFELYFDELLEDLKIQRAEDKLNEDV